MEAKTHPRGLNLRIYDLGCADHHCQPCPWEWGLRAREIFFFYAPGLFVMENECQIWCPRAMRNSLLWRLLGTGFVLPDRYVLTCSVPCGFVF